MSTLAEKLGYVDENATKIREAVTNKSGVDVSQVPLAEIPPVIDAMAMVNGAVEQHLVSEGKSISAGDFVKYNTDVIKEQMARILIGSKYWELARDFYTYDGNTYMLYKTVMLSKDKILLILRKNEYDSATKSNTYKFYATFSSATDDAQISSEIPLKEIVTCTSAESFCVEQISEDKVLFLYPYNSGNCLYGRVGYFNFSSREKITLGEETQLSYVTYTGDYISAVKILSNRVFIMHSYNKSKNIYGMVCEINDTNITHGTDTNIVAVTNYSMEGMSVTKVSEDERKTVKVFIAYSSGTSNLLYGIVCSISSINSITKGTATKLTATSKMGWFIRLCTVDENTVVVKHGLYQGTSPQTACNMLVCYTNETNITIAVEDASYNLSTGLISDDYFLIESDKKLKFFVVTVSNITSTMPNPDGAGTVTKEIQRLYLTDCRISLNDLGKGIMNVGNKTQAYSEVYKFTCGIMVDHTLVCICKVGETLSKKLFRYTIEKVETKEDVIIGVAKTAPDNNEEIEVYVPET